MDWLPPHTPPLHPRLKLQPRYMPLTRIEPIRPEVAPHATPKEQQLVSSLDFFFCTLTPPTGPQMAEELHATS
ncbi:hypothetical protein D623_10017119 [Myotis brandtii]|uniref:Uncharacterized protein n=1 Tax=Myotis brandtii TaxID=109478 RepID=S7N008_MYOBR|nr:hypothetical protein D623_10017119 [Myotis brandtii]